MLSIETETRLAKFFLNLAEGEKSVEITRQVLADQKEFDPYQTFIRLDKENKNYIDAFNVVDFLKVNSVYCTLHEAKFILFFHDSDQDGTLNYSEYLNLILSENDHYLRRIAREKMGSTYISNVLPYDVEFSLSKILERELDLVRSLEIILSDLKIRYDYNPSEIFNLLDFYQLNYINTDMLRKFLVRNGADVIESDLRAIIKRLDINKDGRVSYTEFKSLLSHPCYSSVDRSLNLSSSTFYDTKGSRNFGSTYKSTLRSSSPVRSGSPRLTSTLRTRFSPLRSSPGLRTASPLRTSNSNFKSTRYFSPKRLYSPKRYTSPLRNNISYSTEKSYDLKKSYKGLDEENYIDYTKELIFVENELDRSKTDLALRSDYNIEDVFRLFEIGGRGYITESDFKYGLNKLDVFPTNEELKLVFKRYDLNKEGSINFENFFDMMSPQDREYKRILECRRPYNTELLYSTKSLLQIVLRSILSTERKIESWRQKLERTPGFRVQIAFDRIDRLGKGYFTDADLITFLQRNGISYLNKDIDMLFSRYDKNRDGIVGYSEYSTEIYPNSREVF